MVFCGKLLQMGALPDHELIALLRLQNIPNIGDINAKKLIERCGSAAQVFKERKEALLKIEGIGYNTLASLYDGNALREAEHELEAIKNGNIAYSFFKDADYPKFLKHCIDAPILLFKRGNIDLNRKRIISIVGTRKITSYGQRVIEELIDEIAPLDPVIVSGFAYGVDINAQKMAMEYGLQTIGCLGHGMCQTYPRAHQKYVPLVERNGGFFTEFWSTTQPDRENFLRRNRIIAGISEATVVIESAEKGGSLVTADIAHSYNRDVFAVPGRSSDKYSVGCNNLIKQQKAHMLTAAADLVYILGWQLEKENLLSVQKQLFVDLDDTEKRIYSYLQSNGKQLLDTVALECGFPIFTTSSTLLNMEMKGVVRPLPGKLFEAI